MKNKVFLLLCVLLCTACQNNPYIDRDLRHRLRHLWTWNSVNLEELTDYKWDTLYIVKQHSTLEETGIYNAPLQLKKEIGRRGIRFAKCILVFSHKGKIVKYAPVSYSDYNFRNAPNMIFPGSSISKRWMIGIPGVIGFGLGGRTSYRTIPLSSLKSKKTNDKK